MTAGLPEYLKWIEKETA
ncbi:MAG: hypothetical protein FWD15_05425 [Alphaproteobacteria bacterium]|nr:hypothetical protein [Alphaproteobacteria bacterium]